MSPVRASCPACGAPLTFQIGSAVVTVCEYCHSVVARGDRQLEDLGKVADLLDTGSPLEVGLQGRYRGVPFELAGRAQLGHEAGGVWDEWYVHFADDHWGWLAEAQGRFYLTFRKASAAGSLPPYPRLQLGQSLPLPTGSAPLLLAEKGQARAVSAEGEIPYRLVPGQVYPYADLSGPNGEFATLDYSETPPLLFVGREVTLDDLGIPERARRAEAEARQVEAVQLACPHCGGPLELRAPDRSERVTCPNCNSLLDVHEGQLRYLMALHQVIKPVIPLGSVGQFPGRHPLTAIGFLRRGVVVEGVRYFWEEYLLYHPRDGFRWLVRSHNHWSFVRPLPPGQVSASGRSAYYQGKHFRLFTKDVASVEHVQGEFYWKVTVGEQAQAADYIRPPEMLSREVAQEGQTKEINWSLATYLPAADLEQAFGQKDLPRPAPFDIAPNQPFPYKNVYRSWALLTLAAIVLGLLVVATAPRRKVFEQQIPLQLKGGPEPTQVFFSPQPLELKGHRNIAVRARAGVENSWLDIEGDLIDEQNGQVHSFSLPISYYHGVEGGESWSEGSPEAVAYLAALPAGTYTLRLEFQGEPPPAPAAVDVRPGAGSLSKPGARQPRTLPAAVDVRLTQGVPHLLPWVLTLLALALIPVLVLVYHFFFEKQRWQDSEYSPFHSG